MKRILFLLKKHLESAGYSGMKAGLSNSAALTAQALRENYDVQTDVEYCVDGNSIDKFLHTYHPDYCILEAVWCPPSKLEELKKLHPSVIFIIRVHSEIPFLAHEGNSLSILLESSPYAWVALNSERTFKDFEKVLGIGKYLPNIYEIQEPVEEEIYLRALAEGFMPRGLHRHSKHVNIGCMGALRPMKNQLLQAFAAIQFAEKYKMVLNFHINSQRREQGGESIYKNLRALFDNSVHKLIENKWMDRKEFLEYISTLDIGMQVSMNESFNIVTADFVKQQVPIVVSEAIEWMPDSTKADILSAASIADKLADAYFSRKLFIRTSSHHLNRYNNNALEQWGVTLGL